MWHQFLGQDFDDGPRGGCKGWGGAKVVVLGSGLGAVAVVRPLTWQTFVNGFVASSEWKDNSGRELVDWVLR